MKAFAVIAILLAMPTAKAENFFWGVANSSFQVEGNPAPSDWTRWIQSPQKIADGSNAQLAADFWNKFEEDFKIARDLGLNSFRISLAWERLYPQKGVLDTEVLKHYIKILSSMRRYQLEPVVTLQHFVLPEWLAQSGGLRSPDFVPAFALYAQTVVKALSAPPSSVRYWLTINEPNVLVHMGYIEGHWPPGHKQDFKAAVEATAQLVRAHAAAFNEIKKIDDRLQVSIAHHWRVFEAKNKWNPLDWLAEKITDYVWNEQILNSLTTGTLSIWMPGGGRIKEYLPMLKKSSLDFLGINYYGRAVMSFDFKAPFVHAEEGPGKKSDLGWEIYPLGLEKTIREAYQRYKLPIMITENGLADKDDKVRAQFLEDHIGALKQAQSGGSPVLGYLHWSLTDNFEWAFGLAPRFGLVEIDYAQKAARRLRPSTETYRRLIKQP